MATTEPTTCDEMRHQPNDHDRPDYCHHIGFHVGRFCQWVEVHTGRTGEDGGAHISWANDWEAVYEIAADPTDGRIAEQSYGPGTYGHVSYFLHI